MQQYENLLNVAQAAKYLNVSVKTVYALSSKRQIPKIKIGHALRFRRPDLERWLEENTLSAIR